MQTAKIELNGKEFEIPQADLKWFIEQKGAKEIKSTTSKKNSK